jgi:ATP-binding cassette subfamily G (WHITE) protein 2 (SNQ2)
MSNKVVDVEMGKAGDEMKTEGGKPKAEPTSLSFRNLSVTVELPQVSKDQKETELRILTNVSGSLAAGKLTALMGASGAGKTTLLNSLAGRSSAKCTGKMLINGEPASRSVFRELSSYVTQVGSRCELISK